MKNLKFKKRIVALLLCGAMLLGVVPSSANVLFAAAEDMPGLSTASTSTEVVSMRDANTKHFYMGNGVYQAITYSHPVHELDSEGAWRDIDFGLALTGMRSNRMYTNEASGAAFAEKYVANQPIMTLADDGDSISMTMNTTGISGAASRAANTTIAAEVTNPQKTLRTFEEAENAVFSSKILYEEVLPGVDLEYVVDPGTVKENIIVKEKADTYQYSFSLDLTGLYPVMLEDGSIIVCDLETDEQKYEIPAPFMYDAYGELSEDVAYTLTGSGNTYTLTVTANADWINTEGRNFPITIDPTYVVSTEGVDDTYIDSGKPNTTFGSSSILWARHNRISYIKVPTPNLPSSATVQWAALGLYFYFYEGMNGSVNLTAHRVTTPWDESALTWNKAANENNFGLESTPLAAGFADAGTALEHSPEQVTFTITDTFKKWINGAYNYGIGIKYVSPSESMSVIFYASESGATYSPRITYQYTMGSTYEATVNSYFDNGYSVYYGETNAVSSSKIRNYLVAIKNRYLELLGLDLNISTISHHTSPIDTCKGIVTSSNINTLCSCGKGHTNRDNVCTYYRNNFGGNSTTTTIYWTGHRILSQATDGNFNENRSCSWHNNVFLLERSLNNRETASIGVLMHELNHQYGAPDHYHELADSSDETSCKFKTICSTCGNNPRPSSCIMNNARRDISQDNIICSGCISDMIEHLDDHH